VKVHQGEFTARVEEVKDDRVCDIKVG
jgi:hypothetical protein